MDYHVDCYQCVDGCRNSKAIRKYEPITKTCLTFCSEDCWYDWVRANSNEWEWVDYLDQPIKNYEFNNED